MTNVMVGDSGSGGVSGLAPAPGAGDAAAGKFLKANATWSTGPATSVSWTNYTPTVTPISGYSVAPNGFYKVMGDTLFVTGGFAKDVSVGTGGLLVISLPAGYNIATSKVISLSQNRVMLGTCTAYNVVTANAYDQAYMCVYSGATNSFCIIKPTATTSLSGTDIKVGSEVYWSLAVPI